MIAYQVKDLSYMSYPTGKNIAGLVEYAEVAAKIFKKLYPLTNKSDSCQRITLWCRGASGAMSAALFASYLCDTHHIRIHHIKKPGEYAHSEYSNSYDPKDFNIVIDDFISTGATITAIIENITKLANITIDDGHAKPSDIKLDLLIVESNIRRGVYKDNFKAVVCEKYFINDDSTLIDLSI